MERKEENNMIKKFLASLVIAFGMLGIVTLASTADAKKSTSPTIVEIVQENDGEFDVLEAAVIKAGLVEALNGKRQYTVFAPTDAAFITALNSIDEADAITIVNGLDEDALKNILLYHVTNGQRKSPSVLGAPTYRMLNGDKLTREEVVSVLTNKTDMQASNGIIHIIDGVLMPK